MTSIITKAIALLTMVAGIAGAILGYVVTLPPSEIVIAVSAALGTLIAVIGVIIKVLQEIEKEITAEVNNRNALRDG